MTQSSFPRSSTTELKAAPINEGKALSNTDQLRQEILDVVHSTVKDLAHAIPENSFWALSGYSIMLPQILKEYTRYTLPQSAAIGPIMSYVEAACQGLTGITQLFDDITHRPKVTRAKGVINLASTVNMIALTAASAALGPIGLATGFAVSFTLSMDEAVRQMRRWHSAEYFLVDGLTELDKTEQLIHQKEQEIEQLQLELAAVIKKSKLQKTTLELKKSTLEKLINTRTTLHKQIEAKVDINRYENRRPGEISSLHQIISRYEKVNIHTHECQRFMQQLQDKPLIQLGEYQEAKRTDFVTQKQLKHATKNAVSESLIWGLAFTGILLTCIPGGQIPGVAIIMAVSVLYFVKNSQKLGEKAKSLHSFFKKINANHDEESPTESKRNPSLGS